MSMRMRFIALGGGMFVLLLGWFFLAFRPASSELADVKSQVETVRGEIVALEAKLAQLQELKRNEKELREQAARFERGLPEEPAVPEFIRQVQQIADESGIDFLTIGPSVPSPGAGGQGAAAAPADPAASAAALRSITVSLSATGDFFSLENFVAKMEDLDRAVRIDTFSMSGESPSLSLAIGMRMFMATPAAAAPAAAPAPATSPAPSPASTTP